MTHLVLRHSPQSHNRVPVVIVILCLLLATHGSDAWAQGHGPIVRERRSTVADWVAAAIQPDRQDDIASLMPTDLSTYAIAATLITDDSTAPGLAGDLTLTYTNTTGEVLSDLPFRLYANGPAPDHAAITVAEIAVDDESVTPNFSIMNSVMTAPLPHPLELGASTTIRMKFRVAIPIDATAHYGIFGVNSNTGTWALAHWYPVLAGRDPATGWVLDPPSVNGDPIFTDTALYDVTISAPRNWVVVTTGVEFGNPERSETQVAQRYVSGPARDFTIVADADFRVVRQNVGGVTIASWFNPGEEEVGGAVADYAAQAIELFDGLVSAYPYTTLDLAPVEMYGAAGCEFSQLIYIGHDYYTEEPDLSVPNSLDFTVAHEVVHQWFYGLIGNNQYNHAFIDEGLTQFLSSEIYFGMTYDQTVGNLMTELYLRRPFARLAREGSDWIVDQPTDDFPTGSAYSWAAYVKAPMGFAAIFDAMGEEAFFAALQQYADDFTFRVAQPGDLLAAFESSGENGIDQLWQRWFEEMHATDDAA